MIVLPVGSLVQDVGVTNTTDSPRMVQVSFAARLPNNAFYPLLWPVLRNGLDVEGNSVFERTLNCPIPPNVHTPFVVGFLPFLLDFTTGDTLDIDETRVEITEGAGMNME